MTEEYAERLGKFLPSAQELDEFAASPSAGRLLGAFGRITTWLRSLYNVRREQETAILLAAAHSKVIEIQILLPLGLLHSSYTALRTAVDICISYSFYCSHPVEWLAVCEDRSGWESRGNIIDWHIRYTPAGRAINRAFGLADLLNRDYQELSSYVHGIPVSGLPTLRGIERTSVSDQDLERFIEVAQRIDQNLSLLFLTVFHQELSSLSTQDFRTITRRINRSKLTESGILLPRV